MSYTNNAEQGANFVTTASVTVTLYVATSVNF